MQVAEEYQAVQYLEVGKLSVPRRIKIKTPTNRQIQRLRVVIGLLVVLSVGFGLLALRNARTLVCDDFGRDVWGNKTCIVKIAE